MFVFFFHFYYCKVSYCVKYIIISFFILLLVGICFASNQSSYNQCYYEYSFTHIMML